MIVLLKTALTIAGIGCILLGLFAVLIVVNMFQRPGGIGLEKLTGRSLASFSALTRIGKRQQ